MLLHRPDWVPLTLQASAQESLPEALCQSSSEPSLGWPSVPPCAHGCPSATQVLPIVSVHLEGKLFEKERNCVSPVLSKALVT